MCKHRMTSPSDTELVQKRCELALGFFFMKSLLKSGNLWFFASGSLFFGNKKPYKRLVSRRYLHLCVIFAVCYRAV